MRRIWGFFLLILSFIIFAGCENINIGIPKEIEPADNSSLIPTSVIIETNPNKMKIQVGETMQFAATVYPLTASQKVTWSTNDASVATINSEGLLTAVGEGDVKVTATATKAFSFNNVYNAYGYYYLTVVRQEVAINDIQITGQDSIYLNETVKFNLETNPTDATYTGVWSSSDENVATVDQNGRVTGLALGTVDITYYVNETVKSTKTVNIIARTGIATAIELVTRDKIEVGEAAKLYIRTTPVGSENEVEYIVEDGRIAKIENGKVIGLKEGTTTITARLLADKSITSTITISVKDTSIDRSNLEKNVIDVVANTKNSVLGVSNYKYDNDGDLVLSAIGSGFIYKVAFVMKDGSVLYDLDEVETFADVDHYFYYLITNKHVVEGSDRVKIYLPQYDEEVAARLVQYDDKVDIAVVYFELEEYLKPIKISTDALVSGSFAIAIGNPNGYDYAQSATFGIISYPKRYLPDDTDGDGVNDWDAEYIQHDVAINPGNSGGPLLNLRGEVIGINTLKFANENIDNMGFSIPSNVILELIPYLENGEKPVRAKIGITSITVKNIKDNPKSEIIIPEEVHYGLYVQDVAPGSVAEKGGIQAGDIIVEFNNNPIKDIIVLRAELNKIIVGSNTEVPVKIYRNNEFIIITLVF